MDAARSLFWILAGIEVGIAAVWLAIQAASLDSWFAELVRRIMFIGFFAFVLTQGPTFAKAVVDSLYQIGAGGGSASPAEVFDAGIRVASQMSEQAKFGVFEDNALAIAAVLAMGMCCDLLLAGRSDFRGCDGRDVCRPTRGNDHARPWWLLVHQGLCCPISGLCFRRWHEAHGAGHDRQDRLRVSSWDLLKPQPPRPTSSSRHLRSPASRSSCLSSRCMFRTSCRASFRGRLSPAGWKPFRTVGRPRLSRPAEPSWPQVRPEQDLQQLNRRGPPDHPLAERLFAEWVQALARPGKAAGSAAKEKAIGSPGAYAGSILGLANAKLDQARGKGASPGQPPERQDKS